MATSVACSMNIAVTAKAAPAARAQRALARPAPGLKALRASKVAVARPVARGGLVVRAADPKITREGEKEGAWLSEAEREGISPFKDPMAIAAISGILIPFLILAIAIGTGYVELNN